MPNAGETPAAHGDPVTSLLSGDIVERLRQLEIFCRHRVEGRRSGDNRSPLTGSSPDFLQHRQYFPGRLNSFGRRRCHFEFFPMELMLCEVRRFNRSECSDSDVERKKLVWDPAQNLRRKM